MTPRPLLLCLGLLLAQGVQAGEVLDSDVQHNNGVYRVEMVMAIAGSFDRVRAIVTDYDRLARLSDIIKASSEEQVSGGGIRRRLKFHLCILFFCFSPTMVEDVEEIGTHTVRTTVVPLLSDFKSGGSVWQLTALGPDQTRVRVEYRLKPDFWIPPLIGPLIIKGELLKAAKQVINRTEKLARGRTLH
ncbi:MAG: hypothetical protein P8126_12430 [Gammaproteobacteria bacterium]|jgi:hypothetical protein